MKHRQRDAVEACLLQLPFWSTDCERGAFVADFVGQALGVRSLDSDGSAASDAAAIAALCVDSVDGKSGPASLSLLRATLRDRGIHLCVPDEVLAGAGSAGGAADRPRWQGSPYPGLRPYSVSEAPIFFGRDFEARRLLRLLSAEVAPRLAIVIGRSGSGKTSLVQAGLIARLAAGDPGGPPAGRHWPVATMEPAYRDGDPFSSLAHALAASGALADEDPQALAQALHRDPAALARCLRGGLRGRPEGARWLLVIDRLEQLFSVGCACHREAFFDLLGRAATLPEIRMVATLRSAYFRECMEQPVLRAAVDGGGMLTLPIADRARLAWMARAPLVQLELDHPLGLDAAAAEALADEALTRPAPLTHLAVRLCDSYRSALQEPNCGVLDVLPADDGRFDDACDALLVEMGEEAPAALMRVFSRLVCVDEDAPPIARGELLEHWSRDAPARTLIETLAAARPPLLRIEHTSPARVCLAHESLLRLWRRLTLWIDRRREANRVAARLRADAAAWQRVGCSDELRWPHELLRPARRLLEDADLLREMERDPLMDDFLTPEAERLLAEISCSRTHDARREDIGLRLARIGDPRPGVRNVDDCPQPNWRDVPAGSVLVDGRREVRVAPFRLAAFPVTQAQFDCFLRAEDGFDNAAWWRGLQQRPFGDGRAAHRGNYPATHVSWYDAMAFCRWLGARLGLPIRLPEEWEWQWAAQSGRPDFVYPWGGAWLSGRANTDEAAIGRTTAVGMYPAGNSLQGVSDLAGNTWEWCAGSFELAEGRGVYGARVGAGRDGGARVIRGGSWRVNRGFARADFRLDAMPEDRVGSTGFRLAYTPE